MFFNFKIILLSTLVVSVLTTDQKSNDKKKLRKGIQLKSNGIVKRAIDESFGESVESTSETTSETKPEVTESTVWATNETPKVTVNEVVKEEPLKERTFEELDVIKEGEKIEREGEDDERPVTPDTPREVEATTAHTVPTSLPPISLPTLPSVPSVTLPTHPTTRPVFSFQPTYPTSSFPNYWDNPNWGNWGRFMPNNAANWPQQWPSIGWPSLPSIPSYSPSNLNPTRYSPGSFAMFPSQGIPTFSFLVPQNPFAGGRGFEYPGSRPSFPSIPSFSGFQPSFVPSVGSRPGYYPGIGGQTPNYYPGIGGQTPNYYPGVDGRRPGGYPGGAGGQPPSQPQPQPQPQPGADPNRPMGPMGPEFNDPDVTMIDPNLSTDNSGRRGFPGKVRKTLFGLVF